MRSILENILGLLAHKIVEQYKPVIVGITGSTGKTTTRKAISKVLEKHFRVYTPPRNLNDKLGLPLAIIGEDTAGRSLWGWFWIVVKAMRLLTSKSRYPEVLVLEYGIDRVGEMDELLKIAVPNIGVLTSVGFSHYEFFKDLETVEIEKGKLLRAVGETGTTFVNADNVGAVSSASKSGAGPIGYGLQNGEVRAISVQEDFGSMETTVQVEGRNGAYDAKFTGIGMPHVSAVLGAVAVAEHLGMNKADIEIGLSEYAPVQGRLNFLTGLKKSWLIDDTYNAAPDSTAVALKLFSRIPSGHKIAVLGDMLELGSVSLEEHRKIGKLVAEIRPNHLVTVGEMGKVIAESAKEHGYPEEQTISVDVSTVASPLVHDLVEEGSLVLVKGSQGMRMEKISKEVMAEPMKARELLCRQDAGWLSKA